MTYVLVIHGGAGADPDLDYTEQRAHLSDLIAAGRARLAGGAAAADVVAWAVESMERSGLYVAGKGSAPNAAGVVELDASIMVGPDRHAGAVSAVVGAVSPIAVARGVMDDGRHVMLTGAGAADFARAHDFDIVDDPSSYYTEHVRHGSRKVDARHGTVGAVALDGAGGLAAATSTGGVFNKSAGRVGDTPLIGAGTWADGVVAVSCTGLGEAFIRAGAAHDVSARMRYGGASVGDAAASTLAEVKTCGGDGGIIAVTAEGDFVMPYNSNGMKRAAVTSETAPVVRVFEPE